MFSFLGVYQIISLEVSSTELSGGFPFDDFFIDASPPIDPFSFLGRDAAFRGGAEPSGRI